MYSVCILIYVSISQPIYTQIISTGCRGCLIANLVSHEDEDQEITAIHFKAVIEGVWRYTSQQESSVVEGTLGGGVVKRRS